MGTHINKHRHTNMHTQKPWLLTAQMKKIQIPNVSEAVCESPFGCRVNLSGLQVWMRVHILVCARES